MSRDDDRERRRDLGDELPTEAVSPSRLATRSNEDSELTVLFGLRR